MRFGVSNFTGNSLVFYLYGYSSNLVNCNGKWPTPAGKRSRLDPRASGFLVRRLIASPRKRTSGVKVNGVHLLNQFLITLADKINAYKQKNSASEFFHQHYLL